MVTIRKAENIKKAYKMGEVLVTALREELQRVAIARALVNNLSIILADEPTGV